MSTSTRESSSSPDILGPPGDADYLISSPIKPFAGRQSWLSPANIRRQQTPAKRPRVSLSPAKSAHSIQFNDVVLPGSPTMKLNGRQRSLSPEKMQQDGNVSPWRIRVTLEATQDEENQGSPARKRLRPSTMTTKVPLKDDRSPLMEKTPARRRGRPRKPDIQAQNGSPFPGSRPRKGTPKPKSQELLQVDDQPTPTAQLAQHGSPMDIIADGAGDGDAVRQWSPMNLAADRSSESDSLGGDDFAVADLTIPTQPGSEVWDTSARHEYDRQTYDTPTIGATEHHFLDRDDENLHSTPSKMPSPTRDRLTSSPKSNHRASHTPPRNYPTPTPTSSPIEEDNQAEEADVNEEPGTDQHPEPDPTDDHQEFDSIMESEGFTMISLDTLPSAKQHGLSSSAKMSTSGAPKPFTDRENGVGQRLKRKLPGTIDDLRSDFHAQKTSSPMAKDFSPGPRKQIEPVSDHSATKKSLVDYDVFYPEIPAAHLSEVSAAPKRRTFTSLARLVRVGIALQGPFQPRADEWPGNSNADRKRRLENAFSTFSPETQRELRVALGLGQELAMRRTLAEEKAREEMDAEDMVAPMEEEQEYDEDVDENAAMPEDEEEEQEEEEEEEGNFDEEDNDRPTEEEEDDDESGLSSPQLTQRGALSSARAQREAEWQQTREAVSRHAQMAANAGSTIYIDSDGELTQKDGVDAENEDANEYDAQSQSEIDSHHEEPLDAEPELVPEPFSTVQPTTAGDEFDEGEDGENGEDDGDDDIWQLEARDHSQISHHSGKDHAQLLAEEAASPWRQIAGQSAHQNGLSSSPAWRNGEERDTAYFGQSHIRKLRDEEVDLSAVLGQENTPNRARYYNGGSTPRSILSHRSWAQPSSINGSAAKGSAPHSTGKRVRLQPLSPSPDEMSQEDELSSPVAANESPQLKRPAKTNGDSHVSDHAPSEIGPAQATPEPSRPPNGDAPSSSWFQRITDLTPRWLKAPIRFRDESVSAISDEVEGVQENEQEDDSKNDREDEQEDEEALASIEPAQEIYEDLQEEPPLQNSVESPARSWDERPMSPPLEDHVFIPEADEEEEQSAEQRDTWNIAEDNVDQMKGYDQPTQPRPLAAFGDFSNQHYSALRRFYRMAKHFPERFPYYDAPGRAAIIGDWIWTSNGRHGVPITELQFAVIDRFVQELSRADLQYGGTGQVDWTEADLHRRLISVAIGEQIREEEKAKANRGASVDTWR
ncbi:hypothetical protein NUU61_003302 [Penicillium alfredii]|uniref:AT DNA binding protein n=1 Tax=Penicillium alfredii TaxID=1506179 RepID=A0A9W9FT69_9EURO|nr:uncharacterized protein NUU61_003302 [Penicillium alfredii]KAJ5105955.1 hypothetical protein NUU61_003302 [Penicillium alfredii]